MRRLVATSRGYLMVDVLVSIMILTVAFTAFMGSIAQAARVSARSAMTTDCISSFEFLLFEIENGVRPDLINYGGTGKLSSAFQYKTSILESAGLFSRMESIVLSPGAKEVLRIDHISTKAAIQ